MCQTSLHAAVVCCMAQFIKAPPRSQGMMVKLASGGHIVGTSQVTHANSLGWLSGLVSKPLESSGNLWTSGPRKSPVHWFHGRAVISLRVLT